MEQNQVTHSLTPGINEDTVRLKFGGTAKEKHIETVSIVLEDGKCQFILKKKKRQCRLTPMKDEVYCGEHIIHSYKQNGNQLDVPTTDIDPQNNNQNVGVDTKSVSVGTKRVRCPLDPKHTVCESRLAKHLKICNSRDPVDLSYFRRSVNKLPLLNTKLVKLENGVGVCGEKNNTQLNQKREIVPRSDMMETVHLSDKTPSAAPSFEEVGVVVNKLEKILRSIKGLRDNSSEACVLPDEFLQHPKVCLDETEIDTNSKKGKEAQRHVTQIGSLLRKLEIEGYFGDNANDTDLRDRVFVEMGAGRGQLSYWASLVTDKKIPILLVDNANVKNKFDHHYKYDSPHLYNRINMDIQHLSLSGVPFLRKLRLCDKQMASKPYSEGAAQTGLLFGGAREEFDNKIQGNPEHFENVGNIQDGGCSSSKPNMSDVMLNQLRMIMVTKHLCGAATDFAITCAANYAQSVNNKPNENSENNQTAGTSSNLSCMPDLLLTFCCHHRCSWESYVGKDFFIEHGLTGHDFKVMSRISAWYTCGDKWHSEHTNSSLSSTHSSDSIDSMVKESSNPEINQNEEKLHNFDVIESKQQLEGKEKTSFTAEAKEKIGKECKFLINYGRLKYLEDYHGMKCQMYNYVPSTVTLENVALFAQNIK